MGATICLDTTALIHFEKAKNLDVLQALCTATTDACVPVVVVREWHGHEIDLATMTVAGHDWLAVVPADQPEDLLLVADLAQRYPVPPDKNPGEYEGETEVVALCKRLGYVGLIEDGEGHKQATEEGVASCSIVTLLAAAAAYEVMKPTAAWKVHKAVELTRNKYHSILPHNQPHAAVGFHAAVSAFRQARTHTKLSLGDLLGRGQMDRVLLGVARPAMDRAAATAAAAL